MTRALNFYQLKEGQSFRFKHNPQQVFVCHGIDAQGMGLYKGGYIFKGIDILMNCSPVADVFIVEDVK